MMEYIINAGAYIVFFWVFVFIINPMLTMSFCESHIDYRDAVFTPIIVELMMIVASGAVLLVGISIKHVFGV